MNKCLSKIEEYRDADSGFTTLWRERLYALQVSVIRVTAPVIGIISVLVSPGSKAPSGAGPEVVLSQCDRSNVTHAGVLGSNDIAQKNLCAGHTLPSASVRMLGSDDMPLKYL